MQEILIQQISNLINLSTEKVSNTIRLLNDGGTVPFIARYRKEATGSLDELAVAGIQKEYKRLSELVKRKATILHTIREQGKLTPQLEEKIRDCWSSTELEDLYLPFRPKRQTRATKAREAGLEPLANILQQQRDHQPKDRARSFISKNYPDPEAALQGARDIIAERVTETSQARNLVRDLFDRHAVMYARLIKGKETEGQKYRDYFQFEERLSRIPSHRLLAIRRAEQEGILRVSIYPDPVRTIEKLERLFVRSGNASGQQVAEAVSDAYKRLLAPSIENEFKKSSKEKADREAIQVFTQNLRQLLLAPPLGRKRVLAIDPGFRSGCKLVALDAQGRFLETSTVYPHPPQEQEAEAARRLTQLVDQYETEVIAIGSGTAGRETEHWVQQVLGDQVALYLISEDGASVYSASDLARAEFPKLDLTVRGAISIGRRLLDPLAELVKIDPKSIGVGQYQHDVDQKLLRESLDEVVVSCVNQVGVNLNTASAQLLSYVSGLSKKGAENIVEHRDQKGAFKSREQLLKVKGIGAKAFEQAAGFLRIPSARQPLDNSAVHPERYPLVERMARDLGTRLQDLVGNERLADSIDLSQYVAGEVGIPTLRDILKELKKPGLDPRGESIPFSFAEHIRSVDDLEEGVVLPGKVTNITKFGAFVDIGIKEKGLVHISQLADRFVSDPSEVVALHQIVEVKVVSIDKERGRIGLSMKGLGR